MANVDSGTAALLGAVIGAVVSLGTTCLSDHLRQKDQRKLEKKRKGRLKMLLKSKKHNWRSMEVLSDAIGASEETTARLLIEIDARRSMASGSASWALVSRKPFPDDVA